MHHFGVRLYKDRGRSLPLQSGAKEQSDSDRKEQWTLHSERDQYVTQQAILSICVMKVTVLWAAELPVRMLSTVRL